MSAPKFTPGPWHWGPTKRSGTPDYISGPRGQSIAWGIATPQPYELNRESVANAHLITAAPELYQILSDIIGHGIDYPDLEKIARKALAKARGES